MHYRKRFSPLPPRRLCSTCCQPIHPKAKKCSTCDSYQDWRRYLSMSSSVLALLVALVSVLAFALPIFIGLLSSKDSNIQVSYQGMAQKHALFIVTNEGSRPGSINSVWISAKEENSMSGWEMNPRYLGLSFQPIIVPPGQARQVIADITEEHQETIDTEFWDGLEQPSQLALYIGITFRDFSSGQKDVDFKMPMVDALRAGGTKWHECAAREAIGISNYDSPRPTQQSILEGCGRGPAYLGDPEAPKSSANTQSGKD